MYVCICKAAWFFGNGSGILFRGLIYFCLYLLLWTSNSSCRARFLKCDDFYAHLLICFCSYIYATRLSKMRAAICLWCLIEADSHLLHFLKHPEKVEPQHACQVCLAPVPSQQFSNQNRVFRHILQTLRKPTCTDKNMQKDTWFHEIEGRCLLLMPVWNSAGMRRN